MGVYARRQNSIDFNIPSLPFVSPYKHTLTNFLDRQKKRQKYAKEERERLQIVPIKRKLKRY